MGNCDQVTAIQGRIAWLMLRSGYATATGRQTDAQQAQSKTIDKALYDRAKDFYKEAFYRCVFIGAASSGLFYAQV